MSSPEASPAPASPGPVSPAPVSPAPAAPSRRRRGWRRLLYAAAALGVLAVVLICVVQIVLWSSTPRNLVMTLIEQKLGIRAAADTLDTDWFGRTTLTNVRFALPLADQPFVKIPVVTVHHRWLTGLAITQDIGLRSIELDRPTLWVHRDALGRWNMQDLADMIVNALGPSIGPSAGAFPLPDISIKDATIEVSDALGRSTSIGPIDLVGTRRSSVAWQFTVTIPNHLQATGLLAPGGSWRHELDVEAHDLGPWIAPWINRLPGDTQVSAHWAGQLALAAGNTSLDGLLMLHDFSVASLHAAGSVNGSIGPDAITVQPKSLAITVPNKLLPRADFIGGSVMLANGNLTIQNLALLLRGGPAKLNASYNLPAGTGQLDAAWDHLVLPGGVQHSGNLTAALSRPFPTQLRVDAAVNSTGSAPGGPFTANVNLSAAGSDWTHFDWQARAGSLVWQRMHPLDLSGLQIAGKMRGTAVSLDTVNRPSDPSLAGYGWYDFSQVSWAIAVSGQTWPFHPAEGMTFSFNLDAQGDRQVVRLHDFSLRHGADATLVATGSYVYAIPKPVSLDVRVRNIPDPAHPGVLGGRLDGSAHLTGTFWPRQLDVVGQLHGTNLAFGLHRIGTISLKVSGTVNEERADIQTERLALLGGEGDVDGIYSFAGDALDVGLTVHDLSLAEAGRLIGRDDCSGTFGGHWHLFLPGLSTDPNRIRLTGLFQASDAAIGDLAAVDQLDAQTDLQNGTLTLRPITMLYGNTGNGSGELAVDLANPSELRGAITLTAWPVELPEADGKLSVDLSVPYFVIDLPTASSDLRLTAAKIDLHAAATVQGKPAGRIALLASSSGRIADLQQMHVTLLNGSMDGHGHLDLDQFRLSTAQLDWHALDSAAIAEFVPPLTGLTGRMTGSCTVEPATSTLALEPVAFHLHSAWTDGYYKSIRLRDLTLNGYVNHTQQYSRAVLSDDPNQQSIFTMAGGKVTLWARCGVEPTGVDHAPFASTLAQVAFNQLDVNQLIHAIDPTIKPTRGRLSGSFMLLGNSPPPPATAVVPVITASPDNFDIFAPTGPTTAPAAKSRNSPASATTRPSPSHHPTLAIFINRFYGELHANITESDLSNIRGLQFIYNIMHFSFGAAAAKPVGYGDISARLESGNLTITNLRYFNRGTEVDALATISNVADLPDSPLNGSAIGSAHPLSQIPLPFFSDVDTLLTIIQQQVTPVAIGGTIRTPKVVPAVFKDLTSEMKSYLLGNAEQNGGR
jgi:hypothetical protein